MTANKSSGKKNQKTVQEVPLESINVRLKPVLGVMPRTYVLLAWAFIFLSIIMLFLVLPGLIRNGTYLTVNSIPPDASVIVDGIRLGTSGKAVFVKHGNRNLLVRRTGFLPFEQNIEVSGRIFASRIIPLGKAITVILKSRNDYPFLKTGITDFAQWASTGPEKGRYAIPPVLTQTARDILSSGKLSSGKLSSAALPLSIDERQLADIMRATFLLYSAGAPAGPGTITTFINRILKETAGNPSSLLPSLNLVKQKHLTQWDLGPLSETMKQKTAHLVASAESQYSEALSRHAFPVQLLAGKKFISVPAITLPVGDMEAIANGYNPRSGAIPTMATLESFLISAFEVSNNDFALFVSQNPLWSVENRGQLISAALADDGYLSDWTIAGPPAGTSRNPVTNVSWYAAGAYAAWFTNRYLSDKGLIARIPREDEWEIVARLDRATHNTSNLPGEMRNIDAADTGILGISGMSGNVREWALNPYRVNENLFRPPDGTSTFQSLLDPLAAPDRPVRGGAFIDKNLPYPAAVRGGLPPETTSPVIGFRIVVTNSK